MVEELKKEILLLSDKTIFSPDVNWLSENDWNKIVLLFDTDFKRYYNHNICPKDIKYFPGLLATLFYRISRQLYINNEEKQALEFSSVGFSLTAIELYYTSNIGSSFKINHGVGTVVGAHTIVGNNALFHHNVTIGEKNGGSRLGENVIIYPGATIVGDIDIGNNCIIGANLFVDKSYPAFSIIK